MGGGRAQTPPPAPAAADGGEIGDRASARNTVTRVPLCSSESFLFLCLLQLGLEHTAPSGDSFFYSCKAITFATVGFLSSQEAIIILYNLHK